MNSTLLAQTALLVHPSNTRLGGEQFSDSIQVAQRRDHRFFLTMAMLAAAWVFVGYSHTYYLNAWVPSPRLAILIHIHAAVFSAYLLFYISETRTGFPIGTRSKVCIPFFWCEIAISDATGLTTPVLEIQIP